MVSTGPPTLGAGGTTVVVSLPALPATAYVVHWQVVSAADGHPSQGEFAFGVGAGPPLPGTAGTATPTDWPASAARFLLLLGLGAAMGALVNRRWVWKASLDNGRSADRLWLSASLGTAVAGGAASVFILAQGLGRSASESLLAGANWWAVFQEPVGRAELATLGLVLVAWLLCVGRLPIAALMALVVASVAAALTTHPAEASGPWASPVIAVHVVLALFWFGMLSHLVVRFLQPHLQMPARLAGSLVERYATLALWSAAGAVLTGLLAALAVLPWNQVTSSGYGRLLVAKGVLVGLGLAAAATMRLRALRALNKDAGMASIRRLTRVEASALVAAVAVAALLSGTAPPAPANAGLGAGVIVGSSVPPGQAVHVAGQAGWFEVYATASPGQLALEVVNPGATPATGLELRLSATAPDGRETDLFPRPCGGGCYAMKYLWQSGTTVFHLWVDSQAWAGGRLDLAVPWPPFPGDAKLAAAVMARMNAISQVQVVERVSTGPGATAQGIYNLTGSAFLAGEPYSATTVGFEGQPPQDGLRQLVLYLPGSKIWVRLAIDSRDRLASETIVDPGNLIERTFRYPAE